MAIAKKRDMAMAMARLGADEVADVRRDPLRARLDELVVVELLEALGEDVDLVGETSISSRSTPPCSASRTR